MLWLMFAGIAFVLCLMPLHVMVDLHRRERTLIRLRLRWGLWHGQWRMALLHTAQGRRMQVVGPDGQMQEKALRGGMADKWVRRLIREKAARRFLLRHMHLDRLDAQVLVHTQSASGTALLTGAVQSLVPLLPAKWRSHTRLMIRPDFLHDRSSVNARCILHLRPGTILITAGFMLWASILQQIQKAREALPKWNILSEN